MSHYDLTGPARRDIDEIWTYIAKDNVEAANKLIAKFHIKLTKAADMPGVGSPRTHLASKLRRIIVGKYLLFYRPIEEGGIEVLRVIHSARRIRRTMFKRENE